MIDTTADFMKHFLLFALTIAFLTILVVVRRLKSDTATTISLNAAKHPVSFLAVAAGVTISLVLAAAYYVYWLQPEYELGGVQTILFFGIILSFAVTSWIPDSAGWTRKLHRGAAYSAIFIMPLFLVSLLTVPLSNGVKVIAALVLVALLCMLYLLFFVPKARRWFLPFQGLYLGAFFVVLILATYTK